MSLPQRRASLLLAPTRMRKESKALIGEELLRLAPSLAFFQRYLQDGLSNVVETTCRRMEIEYFRQSATIFEIGDIGDKFYVILEGEVEVLARLPNNRKSDAITEQYFSEETDESARNKLVQVKTLASGDWFGEMSLIFSKPRLATIKTTSKCTVASLGKEGFRELLRDFELAKITQMTNCVRDIPLFSTWSVESRRDIYLNSCVLRFKRGESVFNSGEAAKCVYIIQSGEFSIRKRFPQLETPIDLPKEALLKQSPLQSEKVFTVLKMCANELFGEEHVLKKERRTYAVECSSFEGQLLCIKDIDFITRVYERSDETSEYIRNAIHNKRVSLSVNEANLMHQISKFAGYFMENAQKNNSIPSNAKTSSIQQQRLLPSLQIQNNQLLRRQHQLIYPLQSESQLQSSLSFYTNTDESNKRSRNNKFVSDNFMDGRTHRSKSEEASVAVPLAAPANGKVIGAAPTSGAAVVGTASPALKGFFDIELSNLKKVQISSKYTYQNYLNTMTPGGQRVHERFMIPIRKLVSKVVNAKTPLLADFEKEIVIMSKDSNTHSASTVFPGRNRSESLSEAKTRSTSICDQSEITQTTEGDSITTDDHIIKEFNKGRRGMMKAFTIKSNRVVNTKEIRENLPKNFGINL